MVLQSLGTISEGQVVVDTSQNTFSLLVDTSGNVQNVNSYITGTIKTVPIAGTSLNTGNIPPPGEYGIQFSSSTYPNNYISFTSAITSLNNISWATTSFYTAECWVYPISYNTNGSIIFGKCAPTGTGLDWQLNISSTGYLTLIYNTTANGTQTVTSTLKIATNSWNHVALSFTPTSPTNTFFLCANGNVYTSTLVGTMTTTGSTTNILTLGQYNSTTTLIGYLSSLRVLSGAGSSNALYASTTTPSSSYTIPVYPLTQIGSGSTAAVILRTNPKFLVDTSGIITNMYNSSVITGNGAVSYISTPQSPIYGSFSSTSWSVITGSSIVGGAASGSSASSFISSAPPLPDGAIYLNGTVTGSYITNTNAAYAFNWWQNGGMTIEFWANFISFPSGVSGTGTGAQPTLIGNFSATSTTTPWWSFGPNATGNLVFWYTASPSNVFITSTNSLVTNTWYHIAFTYNISNTTFYMFVNGVLFPVNTATLSGTPTTISSGVLTFGQYNNTNSMNCFISNMRVVKGAALYTNTFTVTSAILNPNISSGTLIALLRAAPFIIDISKNSNTVNIATNASNIIIGGVNAQQLGSGSVGVLPPSGDGIIYIPNIGGIVGNFIYNTASSVYFNWWTTGITCEFWVNYQSFPTGSIPSTIGIMYPTNGINYWSFGAISTGAVTFYYYNGSAQYINTTQTLSLNTWYHLAFSYAGSGNFYIFINGFIIPANTNTISGTPQMGSSATPCGLTIGQCNTTVTTNAYISNIRLVNGGSGSALYTSAFAVPTQPLGLAQNGTTVALYRVPPSEIPLSQTSLVKSYVGRYRPNVNINQGPIPGAIVLVNTSGINIGYTNTNTATLPIIDKQVTNSILFNGSTNYFSLPTITFSPFIGFTFVATISLSSSINIGSTLFIIGDTTSLANYISIKYSALNTLSFNICANNSVTSNNATVSLNTFYSIVYTYTIGTINIYINNSLLTTTSINLLSLPQVSSYSANYIGCSVGSGGSSGSIGGFAAFSCYNFAVYNRNFITADVLSYYSIAATDIASLPTIPQLPMGPIIDLSYPMNEIIVINPSSIQFSSVTSTGLNITYTGTFSTSTLYYYGTDGKTQTFSSLASGSSTSVSSLNPNTQYRFVIIPYNSAGISSSYGTVTTTCITLATLSGLYTTIINLNSCQVSWALNGYGSSYSYLIITMSPTVSNSGLPITITASTQLSSTVVNNLSKYTSYTFTVTPYNNAGVAGTPVITTTITGFIYTFTNMNGTGYTGPSSITYTSNPPSALTLTSGIQYWTVPAAGIYNIIVAGAAGGNSSLSGIYFEGGYGVILSNNFTFTTGQIISILVGQKGSSTSTGGVASIPGAGGGGTYVAYNSSSTPVLIAGGGGGGGNAGSNNMRAVVTTSGVQPSNSGSNGGAGGTSGNAGGAGSANGLGNSGGQGGGGFNTGSSGNCVTDRTTYSFLNGGVGSTTIYSTGGFGGGGASGSGNNIFAGGGGGYSGGGGGTVSTNGVNPLSGGGGGSYDSANSGGSYAGTLLTSYGLNGYNTGDGYVIISQLSSISTYTTMPSFNAATGIQLTQFTVNWNLPVPTPSSTATQTIVIFPTGGSIPTLTYTSTSATITGLTAGNRYSVTLIISNNSAGYADVQINQVVSTLPQLGTLSVSGRGTNYITIASSTATFAYVVITWNGGSSGSSVPPGTISLPGTPSTSLATNTAYTFSVTPYNAIGTSGTTVNIGPVYTAAYLTGYAVTFSGNAYITVSWTANGSGSNYSRLDISWSPATAGSPATNVSGSSYSTPSNLSYVQYTFTFTVYNGDNTTSTYTTTGYPANPIPTITNFRISSTTPTSVAFSWASTNVDHSIITWSSNGSGNNGTGNWTSNNITTQGSYTASSGICGNPSVTFTITPYNSGNTAYTSSSTTVYYDGSTANLAGISATNIMTAYTRASLTASDGVYWIYLSQAPTPTSVLTYCIMNTNVAGGGWMMVMKATQSTTFQYLSTYWTDSTTLLNTSDTTRNNADAKFNTFNYLSPTDLMAIWPDFTGSTGGGLGTSAPGNPYGCWTWLQQGISRGTYYSSLTNFFNSVNLLYFQDAKTFSGWASGVFSSQVDIRFYGFNFVGYNNAGRTRWGFGWNENGEGLYYGPATLSGGGGPGTDDVFGGIGMDRNSYSAGDNISCCNDTSGYNRSARVEMYMRSNATYLDGSTSALAAPSALAIIQSYVAAGRGLPADGVYWINLPTVGATQIYCIMNTNVSGGGWMMAMKATRGTTFNYNSSHWTSVTTLNTGDNTRNDGDAKFNTMNYYVGSEMLALWPDITTTGGSLGTSTTSNPFGCWSWQQIYSQYYGGSYSVNNPSTMIALFNSAYNITFPGVSYSQFSGWGSYWSVEGGNNFYGFNFNSFGNQSVRWGVAFNNETDWGSNDVGGGIGTITAGNYYSAGDYNGCCATQNGINRSARVEIYVR